MHRAVALVCVLVVAALAGCGDGDGGGSAPAKVSPDRAADAAVETKVGLDRALEQYREGDRVAAADELRDVRDEHFSLVERGLRGTDAALAAQLRRAMYTTLPKLVDEGVTVSALAKRLVAVEASLDAAEDRLRAAG